jgi:hypothetical protein
MDTWELTRGLNLLDHDDAITWKMATSGVYSAKTTYNAFFVGRTRALAAAELQDLHMWFAMKNRLCTADRLARRGMEHPSECPLCYQKRRLQCSYTRQIWYMMLLPYRLHIFTPGSLASIEIWWSEEGSKRDKLAGNSSRSMSLAQAQQQSFR